jgi:SpoVK/Ycf46/Vps4 family AAA+-type ATPase
MWGGEVARSALLRSLFTSWAAGSDSSFLVAARSIIDEERKKGHRLLAGELEDALSDPRRPGAREPLSLRPVPKGRDERPLLSLNKARWTFADLAYSSEVSASLRDLVEENERRTLLVTHALRPRQRILLVGPSGAGKTAAAHAVAAQLSLPVASANLAALTSSYLGETARNIESVVRFAETTPCVLVLDEFDALASERATPGDHGELRRVVATVLQALEDVRGESLVIATSNHPQMLDSAVWRRFDEVIRLTHPASTTIHTLLRLRLSDRAGSLDLEAWSGRLGGSSAAEVELISLDALRHSILDDSPHVTDAHLRAALDRLDARKQAVHAVDDHNNPNGPVLS